MLTLEAAHNRGLDIKAIVLNRKASVPADMDNAAELANHTNLPIFPLPEKCEIFHTFTKAAFLDTANACKACHDKYKAD